MNAKLLKQLPKYYSLRRNSMSDAEEGMGKIVSSFLLLFLGISMAGLITVWLVGYNEISSLFTVPMLLLGSFLFALLTALLIGAFLHHIS